MPAMPVKYKRILLKLSGEALCGIPGGFGIEPRRGVAPRRVAGPMGRRRD